MNFLCPACRTPLPRLAATTVLPCTQCGVEVDVARMETSPGASAGHSALRADVDLTGETLGRFALRDRLGAGGMGVVYAAEAGSERFAVKVLGGMLAADPALRTRFRREAAALRAIAHEGVVRVIEEGEERGFCWYAMERVDGSDLRTRLKAGALDADEVTSIAGTLLEALAVVHAAGFVHRDVKPGNVLLTRVGAPKLCDFGIAHVDGAATLTESAAILGSLRYMAPEQRLGRASARSDLYALGVTLHECLTGGSVPDEAPLPSGVPRRLKRLVTQLTALRANERPADARTARRMLEPSRIPGRARASGLAALLALGIALFSTLRPSPVFKPPPDIPGVVPTASAAPLKDPAKVIPRPPRTETKAEFDPPKAPAPRVDKVAPPKPAPVTEEEPLPELVAEKPAERAKPGEFVPLLDGLAKTDPARAERIRTKIETLDPAPTPSKKPEDTRTDTSARLPARTEFADDEAWLQAIERIDPKKGRMFRDRLAAKAAK